MAEKTHRETLDEHILKLVDSVSPAVGKVILEEYDEMSNTVKKAVNAFYAALDKVSDKDSIDTIKDALHKLRDACEANPAYKDVYDAAKKEAQDEIAEMVANEGMELFSDDE